MIIKKFQAKTEDEALELAKAELGDNVVVLNTKKDVKRKGFLGLFRAKLVEVTVAKEEEQEVNARMEADDLKGAIASVNKIRTQAELGISPESMDKVDDMVSQKLDNIQSLLQERLDKESINKESIDDEVRKKYLHLFAKPSKRRMRVRKAVRIQDFLSLSTTLW